MCEIGIYVEYYLLSVSLYNSETIYYLSSLYLHDLNYLTLYLFRRYLYIGNVQVIRVDEVDLARVITF